MGYQVAVVAAFAHVALSTSLAAAHAGYPDSYAASTDLSEVVVGRDSSPANGSFFYAYLARWECSDDGGIARRVASEGHPFPGSKQGHAVQQQLERCRNLPLGLTNVSAQRQDVEEGRVAGDKLFGAFKGTGGSWFRVHDQADLLRALRFLAPDSDPNMSWVVAQKLGQLGAERRILVDGQRPSETEGRSLYVSFLLAACDINVDCGSSHRWMRGWCLQNAECDDPSLEAYWRRKETGRDSMDWTSIARYRAIITASARTANWSSFSLAPER